MSSGSTWTAGSTRWTRVSGTYPNYRLLLDFRGHTHKLQTDRDALTAALTAGDADNALLRFEPGRLVVTIGDRATAIAATYVGAGVQILVNRRYALDGAGTFDGKDIAIEAASPDRAIVFRSAGGMHLYLLMPIKQSPAAPAPGKFCKQCRHERVPNARHCTQCGAPFDA